MASELLFCINNGFQHTTIPLAFPASHTRPPFSCSSMARNCATAFATPLNRPNNTTNNKVSSTSRATRKPRLASRSDRDAAIADIQQSSDLCSALARSGGILMVSDLNIILRNFGRSSRWKDLSQLFEWMQRHGKMNFVSYSSYIKFMADTKNTSAALRTYESINDVAMRSNTSICNSVLNCLVKNGDFDKANNFFEQMKQSGLQPDAVTYSTMLSGCMKVEDGYRKALELVKELEKYGIVMDGVIYGTLIAVCASKCQSEEAEKYFIRMKDEGHSPNMYHYSSLLNAYSVNGDYQKADELVNDIKAAGLVPNKVVLTTLLKVYVRGALFEKSRLMLSQLEALGYAEDEMPYCILMDGLSKSGKIDEAKMVFNEMRKRQVRADGYAHSIMISAFCRAGRLEEAKKLAGDYEALYNKYDLVILNVMLFAYCRAGDLESVMQTLRKMDRLTISPDKITFGILIKYFSKEKLYLLAYKTVLDMHSKGHQIEEEILSPLILHLGRVGAHSEALSVYNILRSCGTAVCKTLHNEILLILLAGQLLEEAYVLVKENAELISPRAAKSFLTAFMKLGDINSINDALETIHTMDYKIDEDVFHQAILRYIAEPENKELFLQLLQWMPSHGYVVDSLTRNLILKNSMLFGKQIVAETLSRQHAALRTLRSC